MQKVAKELLGMLSWPGIAARLAAAEAAVGPLSSECWFAVVFQGRGACSSNQYHCVGLYGCFGLQCQVMRCFRCCCGVQEGFVILLSLSPWQAACLHDWQEL